MRITICITRLDVLIRCMFFDGLGKNTWITQECISQVKRMTVSIWCARRNNSHYLSLFVMAVLTSFELGMDDFRTVQKPAINYDGWCQ